jgi:hypothetical protein
VDFTRIWSLIQKRPDLLQAQPLSISHADLQVPACLSSPPSGSFCVRNKPPLQAHLALEKATLASQRPVALPWNRTTMSGTSTADLGPLECSADWR